MGRKPQEPDEHGWYEARVTSNRERPPALPWQMNLGLVVMRLILFGVPPEHRHGTPRAIALRLLKDAAEVPGAGIEEASLKKQVTALAKLIPEVQERWGPGTTEEPN
jgi:hypothetical protein